MGCVKLNILDQQHKTNITYTNKELTFNFSLKNVCRYLVYGEILTNKRSAGSNYNTPYKFSAKEKDAETGFNYFGARYYVDYMYVWLSVDPMSDKYPHQSPYMYCSGNPVMKIDPNGMSDDGFVINELGYTTKVNNEGGNKYDVIYNKSDYYAGKRDYDKSGKKSGFQIDRGELSNFRTQKINITDAGGYYQESVTRTSCEVKSQDVADNFHTFLERNTYVEWNNSNFTDPNGKSVNLMITSQEHKVVEQGVELMIEYLDKGYTLNRSAHNHPWNYSRGGEVSDIDGDLGAKQRLQSHKSGRGKNAIFIMFFQGKPTIY